MKRISALAGWLLALTVQALAQSSMQEETKSQFTDLSKFMVTIISGPVAKIIALILLIVGIWKIINRDYGTAVGCILALLVLVFLPQIVSVFGR